VRFSTAIAKYAAWKRARGVRFGRGEDALRTLLRSAGDRSLHQVTPKQISAYLDGSRMSTYTWWREYQIIRSFFQFWQSRNKLDCLPMPRPRAALPPPFRPYIFSRTELLRLLMAFERTPLFDPMTMRNFLLFLYGTGARIHEANRVFKRRPPVEGVPVIARLHAGQLARQTQCAQFLCPPPNLTDDLAAPSCS
jgi:integrase